MTQDKRKQSPQTFKAWVPVFRTYKLTDEIVAVDGHMPVFATKKEGLKHWATVSRATLTIDKPKKRKGP